MSVEVIKQVITEDYNRIFLLPSLDLLKKQFQKIIRCIGKPTSYTCNIFDNNSTEVMGNALLEEGNDKRYERRGSKVKIRSPRYTLASPLPSASLKDMIVQNDLTVCCWVCDISRGKMYNDRLKSRSEWSNCRAKFLHFVGTKST